MSGVHVFSPPFFMIYDVLLSLLLFGTVTLCRQRLTFVLAYLLLLFFVVANVVYSRFFYQYMPLHVFTETGNLHGTWWHSYLPQAFRLQDVFLLANVAAAFYVVKRIPTRQSWRGLVHLVTFIFAFSLFYAFLSYAHSLRSNKEFRFGPLNVRENMTRAVYNPAASIVNYGVIQGQLLYNALASLSTTTLNEKDAREIDTFIEKRCADAGISGDSCKVSANPNVVMIILESGLSAAVEENIGGKDVMPNLKALTRQDGTYYNPHVLSNKGIGESSDAQVSYFTGLQPLSDEYAIMYVLKDSIIGLPSLLSKKGYATSITIPNNEDFWHQKELNEKYGFAHLYALGTVKNDFWCEDDEIFDSVIKNEKALARPFFHTILTLSMHGAYDMENEEIHHKVNLTFPANYSKQYRQYLIRCNFTDKQIGKYIDYMRREGLFDNTVLVIVSDHEPEGINMPLHKIRNNELPLIIVNSGIDTRKFSSKECNQVDLFPTLLDMMGIESKWRGIGRSLLRDHDSYKLNDEEVRVSTNILRGNYFAR